MGRERVRQPAAGGEKGKERDETGTKDRTGRGSHGLLQVLSKGRDMTGTGRRKGHEEGQMACYKWTLQDGAERRTALKIHKIVFIMLSQLRRNLPC